jgi:branched-chain amino acid transport system substrate-binding protein
MPYTRILASISIIAALAFVPAGVRAADPYEIYVLTSLTGQNALIGKQTADSLHIIEARVNQTGGIGGRPVRFVIEDDQTNPQVAVLLAKTIIAKNVPVILGPAMTANCNAVFPLVQDDGPVLWCFTPGFHPPKDSFGFSSNASTTALIRATAVYCHALGLNKVALIASTDATGQDGEKTLDATLAAPDLGGMSVVAREHFNVTDLSVAAQVARVKASGAQVLFAWTTATPLATVLHGVDEAGLDIPVVTTPGNSSATQLKSYAGFVPKTLIMGAMVNQVSDPAQLASRPNGPLKRKIDEYYGEYKTTLGILPDGSSNIAWDSAIIVLDALRKYGPNATPRQIHDYIENLHGWVGINGEYDFRDGSQRGLSEKNIVVVRWDPAGTAFVAVSKPGGLPLR